MTDTITPDQYRALTTRRKFGNRRIDADGHRFDSAAEYSYYLVLKARAERGEITGLRVHPVYVLQERFHAADGSLVRAITYIADFAYMERDREIACDVKGVETTVWRVKRALFLRRYSHIRLEVVKV